VPSRKSPAPGGNSVLSRRVKAASSAGLGMSVPSRSFGSHDSDTIVRNPMARSFLEHSQYLGAGNQQSAADLDGSHSSPIAELSPSPLRNSTERFCVIDTEIFLGHCRLRRNFRRVPVERGIFLSAFCLRTSHRPSLQVAASYTHKYTLRTWMQSGMVAIIWDA